MGAIIARAVTLYARGTHSGCVVGNTEVMDMRIDRQVGLWNLINDHTFEHRIGS